MKTESKSAAPHASTELLSDTSMWKAKKRDTIPCLHDAKVSTWLEKNSTSEEKHRGLDLADFLVRLPAGRKLKLEEFL